MQTNQLKEHRERIWEERYGTIGCIISSTILVVIIALLWPK